MFKFKKIFILAVFAAFLFAKPASAAVIYLSASDTTINKGDKLTITLRVDSEEVNINAAQASLGFPANILAVESIDKTGSVFNFWLEDPVFSNTAGTVSFIGGSTSGYSGRSLSILTINFNVIGTGNATISLSNGAVTTSDGTGANVLRLVQGITLISGTVSKPQEIVTETVTPGGAVAEEKPVVLPPTAVIPAPVIIERVPEKAKAGEVPARPALEVPFYSSSEKWYNSSNIFLAKWVLSADISGVATAIDNNPAFEPEKSEGLFDNKFFKAPAEGINYLHIRFKNNNGWGETAHYKIAIDTVPPAPFEIIADKGLITDWPTQKLTFESNDEASGIESYIIKINNDAPITIKDSFFDLPLLGPGEYTVRINAMDAAGNTVENSVKIEITPIANPSIISVSRDSFVNEGNINISGTSLSDASIILNLTSEAGQVLYILTVKASEDGVWSGRFDQPLKKGLYYIEATAKDGRGALSLPVKSDFIKVRIRPILTLFGLEITSTVFYVAIIILLIGTFFSGWFAYRLWRNKLGSRVIIAQRDVNNVFNTIEKDADKILLTAEKATRGEGDGTECATVEYLVSDIKKQIARTREYVLENIEEIKD
jgi:hypothetical protein